MLIADRVICAYVQSPKSSVQGEAVSPLPRALRSLGDWGAHSEGSLFLGGDNAELGSTYHREGEWQSIIAAEMDFPDHLPAKLRATWKHNCELARNNNVTLTAQQFAELVVDENFGAMNAIP
jgi:hypothetical protein